MEEFEGHTGRSPPLPRGAANDEDAPGAPTLHRQLPPTVHPSMPPSSDRFHGSSLDHVLGDNTAMPPTTGGATAAPLEPPAAAAPPAASRIHSQKGDGSRPQWSRMQSHVRDATSRPHTPPPHTPRQLVSTPTTSITPTTNIPLTDDNRLLANATPHVKKVLGSPAAEPDRGDFGSSLLR